MFRRLLLSSAAAGLYTATDKTTAYPTTTTTYNKQTITHNNTNTGFTTTSSSASSASGSGSASGSASGNASSGSASGSASSRSASVSGSASGSGDVAGQWKDGLRCYSLKDVSAHSDEKSGIWVFYRQGVYDITTFIGKHPGGASRIVLASGGSIEPFWNLYSVHKQQGIYDMLEEMRIGNLELTENEIAQQKHQKHRDISDIYANEPYRHPALRVRSERPFNAETPGSLLSDNFITSNELFFVRNHLPVPPIDSDKHKLRLCGLGLGQAGVSLSMHDIKTKFPKHEITMTIQCAGNRRTAFKPFKPVKGLEWEHGAIGTATWGGARLRDVLSFYGISLDKANQLGIEHVQFEGLDTDLGKQHYGASIPINKALQLDGDVILAYEMNGSPLPLDHGLPLRAIVPGVVGARNVKWLSKIMLSEQESQSFWQQNDYRVFSPSVDWDTVDWRRAPSIQEYPVQSGICFPQDGTQLDTDQDAVTVRGYAWSGGGRAIIRVDVSIDGGTTWNEARLRCRDKRCHDKTDSVVDVTSSVDSTTDDDEYEDVDDWHNRRVDKAWAWVLWNADIDVPPELRNKKLEICSRAVDASYNTQPESAGPIWNLRGCLCNCWHRITVNEQNNNTNNSSNGKTTTTTAV
eukprot:GHVS01080342.1.p1 GENE.GHVS01080342.1~~GHVS01080342.1.p1  ORF type:complete len:634 (-),score=108.57 GHVS01080342.1:313-2214(-)